MFTNTHFASSPTVTWAQASAELCDPIKGRSLVSTLSYSLRASYAQLNWTEASSWTLSISPVPHSLFLFFFFFSLCQYQSLSVQPLSLCHSFSVFSAPPPPQVSHTGAIVACAFDLYGSSALSGCRGKWGAPFL